MTDNGDGQTCSDINDCADEPCGNGECSDTGANSYSCDCESGHTFTGVTCSEIRPCDDGELNDCDENASCNHDGPGEHSCVCNVGYSGDGTTCADTDGLLISALRRLGVAGQNVEEALSQDSSEACSAFGRSFASLIAPRLTSGEIELECPANSASASAGQLGCVCDEGFQASFMLTNEELTLVGSCEPCAADDADCLLVSALRRLGVAGQNVEEALSQDSL